MDVAPPTKPELRTRFGAARRARDPVELAAARQAICSHVRARCAELRPACVAAYVPLRTEPGSVELLDALADQGIAVIVPVLLADRGLDWVRWQAGAAGSQQLGVDAIARADLALVPALAVATDGTRLGRGGGSYDRSLALAGAHTSVAAVLFDDELVDELPRDPWDRPVEAVVQPGGWRELGHTAAR